MGLIFIIGAAPAWALDFQSSRTLSLSQAGRGGALLNDTITLNPALLGFQPVASVSGTFNWINNAQTPAGSDRAFNVSVIDGKNQYVNAGISFTRRPDLDFIHVGLAKRVLEGLSIGASVKRFTTRSNTLSASGNQTAGFDGGVSVAVAVPPAATLGIPVQLGLTADNLRNLAREEERIGPRQYGAGLKVNLSSLLMLYGDAIRKMPNNQGSYMSYAGGAEVALGGDFYARGGLMGMRERGWSAGGGWVGPKIGISYGYQNRRLQAERSFDHAVTCDIFM